MFPVSAALLGGICSKYKPYSESGSKRLKSLNTGVVTVKNYGERVPKLMSKLTLAHEIGHNFGSQVRIFSLFQQLATHTTRNILTC